MEAGFIPDDLFVTTEPFTTQNSNFALGGESQDVTLIPKQFPNQLIYASSASSIDQYFFKKYKEFSKRMFLGDKKYFVADIKDEVVMSATFNGKVYPVSLLVQETIDNAMRENPEKANREYKNIFSKEGGDNQIIKRASIIRNSKNYKPILTNETNEMKFILAQDPARKSDNSITTIGLLYHDEHVGYKLRLCNCVNFLDKGNKVKQQMRIPDQIKEVKILLNSYNGKGKAQCENIHKLLVDAGAGGQGLSIADEFMEDYKIDGKDYRGLIDKENCSEYITTFPNALDKLKLISPQKYKRDMFDALVEMMNMDLIEFPSNYDGRGYLRFEESMTECYTDEDNKSKKKTEAKENIYKLSDDEILSLVNLDLAKEELVNIHRIDSSNENYRYDLPADKKRKMHDDKAYTIAMLAWELKNIRRDEFYEGKGKQKVNILDYCM